MKDREKLVIKKVYRCESSARICTDIQKLKLFTCEWIFSVDDEFR